MVDKPVVRWLALTLTGWLIYALARALWTIIALGTPLYDWQWYLPIIILLIFRLVRLIWRVPHARTILLVLVIWVVGGYNGFGIEAQLSTEQAPPILTSFWAYSDSLDSPESVLQDLQTTSGRIYLDIGAPPYDGERGERLTTGLRRLADHDIQVYLAIPASDFLSVSVYQEWMNNIRQAVAFVEREGLTNVRGMIGDAEHPLHGTLDILGMEYHAFSQTTTDLRQLITTLRREHPHLRFGVTATWPQYVDGFDHDTDLALAMRSPVDPPDNWNFVNLMTYSSYFPPAWRAYYVYSLERAMARRYPKADVSHLIGLVGGGFSWEPLLDFDGLVRDARLSRALGVREVVVFQLDGALKVFGNDFVRRFTAAVNDQLPNAPIVVPFSRPAAVVIYSIVVTDALLDVRGWGSILWIAWMIMSSFLARRPYR